MKDREGYPEKAHAKDPEKYRRARIKIYAPIRQMRHTCMRSPIPKRII